MIYIILYFLPTLEVMRKMGKANAIVMAALVTALALTPVQGYQIPTGLSGELTIAGSTTVLPINQECAQLLRAKNPGLRISVSGGGSGHGIRAVGSGEIDIGAASRDIKPEEMEKYPDLKPVVIGHDSVAIVVHPSNPVNDLSMDQISRIFAGEITNWKEVGGEDRDIRVITREEGSGTREVFEKYVMKPYNRELRDEASVKPSNGEVRATVGSDPASIGYISLGYIDNSVKALRINGVEATVENVLAGRYPIRRNLYLITKGEPGALEKAFIDFVCSDKGQEVVKKLGYIGIAADETPATATSPAAEATATPVTTPATEETPATATATPGFGALIAVIATLLTYMAYGWRRRDE